MGKGKALALKNAKKTEEDRSKAKPNVKKRTKKMPPPPSIIKKKQKSHQLKGLGIWTDVSDVNKWLQTFNNYLHQKLTIQKNNYFFGDDGVREKITKICFLSLIIYDNFLPFSISTLMFQHFGSLLRL